MLIFLWFFKKKSLASQYYKESPVAIEDALTHMVNLIEMHCFFSSSVQGRDTEP